jgi:hypothetical protein
MQQNKNKKGIWASKRSTYEKSMDVHLIKGRNNQKRPRPHVDKKEQHTTHLPPPQEHRRRRRTSSGSGAHTPVVPHPEDTRRGGNPSSPHLQHPPSALPQTPLFASILNHTPTLPHPRKSPPKKT